MDEEEGIPRRFAVFSPSRKDRDWNESRFLPKIGPTALYGLRFTVAILFALQANQIVSRPLDVARIALPLLAYFAITWAGSHAFGKCRA